MAVGSPDRSMNSYLLKITSILVMPNTNLNATKCQFEKLRGTRFTFGATQETNECHVINSEVFSSGQDIRICLNFGNEFTENDAVGEDIRL